jgi:monovalent cation:proton antiporter-2 (CPA2) family protein
VVVPICKRLGLSSVLGYLAAGLLIGPPGLALIADPTEEMHFAELGVVLLLFVIGLELQPRRLWVMRRAVFGLGTLQVLSSTLVIGGGLWLLGLQVESAAIIGFALALSSTAFVLQLLAERKQLNSAHGRAAFGTLLLQDIAVIPAVALLNLLGGDVGSGHGPEGMNPLHIAAVVAGAIVLRFALRPILRFIAETGIQELFTAAALALVAGAALAMESAGLSMGLGAFIAGMMVADSEYRHQMETDVNPFKGLLLGLFFIAVGMVVDIRLLFDQPLTILGLAVALMLVKTLVMLPLARWHGLNWPEALRAGIVLSQGGEFAFVLIGTALSAGIVAGTVAAATVLVVTLSMALTPFLVTVAERLLAGGSREERPFDDIEPDESNMIVIAGFGRVGQIIARVLTTQHIHFTALDADPAQVDFVRKFGNKTYFGDASRLDVMRAAQVGGARALVVAVGNPDTSVKIVRLAREAFPNLRIFARAITRHHEIALREAGVDYVIRETLLSSLAIAEALLKDLGRSPEQAAEAVARFRAHDARTLEQQAAVHHDEEAFRQVTITSAEELKTLFQADDAVK